MIQVQSEFIFVSFETIVFSTRHLFCRCNKMKISGNENDFVARKHCESIKSQIGSETWQQKLIKWTWLRSDFCRMNLMRWSLIVSLTHFIPFSVHVLGFFTSSDPKKSNSPVRCHISAITFQFCAYFWLLKCQRQTNDNETENNAIVKDLTSLNLRLIVSHRSKVSLNTGAMKMTQRRQKE